MERLADKLRAFALAVGVHLLLVLAVVIGLAWTRTARPVSVPGPIIEATLVSYTPPPSARIARPKPVRPPPPQPRPEPERVRPPDPIPAPPRAQDTIDRERVDRMAIEPSRAEREQEERRKRDQELLQEQERLTQMERERQQQLDDIRRRREQAQRQREIEQQRLAQLENRERREADRAQQQRDQERREELQQAEQRAGNEGEDDSLRARYVFALQQTVTANWLRPDNALAGLRCTVRIAQIPGGQVLSASVVPPCNGDDLTRRSLEAAVLRAQPLPYQGYEKVFERSIDFVFHYDG
jgi:colicin import membrane protein